MSTTVSTFAIEEYRQADEPAVLSLLHQCLGNGTVDWRDGHVWRWKHVDNPFGPSLVLVAHAPDGGIIGLRAFMRWEMTAGTTVIRAYRPVDTATDPAYRRLGIFSALTKEALRRARDEGVALTFNTPNPVSLPGYLKLGWQLVTPIRPVVKVTHLPRFLARSAAGLLLRRPAGPRPARAPMAGGDQSVRELLEAGDRVESVVTASDGGDAGLVRCRKSSAYLRWRYLDDPVYEHAAVWAEDGGATRGCAFLRPVSRSGARGMLIEDLFLAGQRAQAARGVLRRIIRQFRPDFLMTYFSSASSLSAIMRELGFRTLSRRESHFVVHLLGEVPVDLLRAESWILSMGEVELL